MNRTFAAFASSLGITTALLVGSAINRPSLVVPVRTPSTHLVSEVDHIQHGYWLVARDGGVFAFDLAYYGSDADSPLTCSGPPGDSIDCRAAVATIDGGGYRILGAGGFIGQHGDAGQHSGPVTYDQNCTCVSIGLAGTHSGHGYWTVQTDGTVAGFGDAQPYGGYEPRRMEFPIGIAGTADDRGYWLVQDDGGVFGFGDAAFHGSTGNLHLNSPIVGMAATPSGAGYWLVAADGGIFSFGDASFHGSTGAMSLNKPIVGMAATPSGNGYWLVASDGGVFTFGDATFHGSTGALKLNSPIVAIVPA